ncbi:hypothetical protein J3R83DRAFT_12533 [Lanmaoa asiatica]|nr:hypothetical protein J3R83DRAFT_12533 [Lanmaoa asiatica]
MDEVLWRCTRHTSFWTKDIWILPIHRPGHWVLCIAQFSHHELFLFDSLGQQHPWCADIEDIMKLVSRLLGLAHRHHPTLPLVTLTSDWVARPLSVHICLFPLMASPNDCTRWNLCKRMALIVVCGFSLSLLQRYEAFE